MKPLTKEQIRIKELMGFTYKDNSHDILSEQNFKNSLTEQDDKPKKKRGGFSLGKSDINIFGRTGGHVDFNWEIDMPINCRNKNSTYPVSRYEQKALKNNTNPFYFQFIKQ